MAVGDGDLVVVDEDEDLPSGVGAADAEVVEFAGTAEGEFAELVDRVVANTVVGAKRLPCGGGFDGRGVGLCGGDAGQGSVWSLLVIDGAEPIELGL